MYLASVMTMLVLHFVTTHGISSKRHLDGHTELVRLSFLDAHLHQDSRTRRSSDATANADADAEFTFPEQLLVNVTTNDVSVTLLLTFSHVNGPSPPVFEFDERGDLVERVPINNQSYAFYQDVNNGASFRVACAGPDPEQCKLDGSFYHRQHKFSMQPHHSFATTGLHSVQHAGQDTREFGDDAPLPPDSVANENTKPANSSGQSRKNPKVPEVNIVETLALPDDAIYEAFLEAEGSHDSAVDAMTLYYGLLFNEIDLHYLSVPLTNPRISIRIALAAIIIAKNRTEAKWSTDCTVTRHGTVYLDANRALYWFTMWRNRRRGKFPTHDHAMAFTGKDFERVYRYSVTSGLAGVAYLRTVCRTWDTSIVEDDGHRTSNTAAHELGHSLGSLHDDSDQCPRNGLNVMTPMLYVRLSKDARAQDQWTFSSCSVKAFAQYIDGLATNCMTQHDTVDPGVLDEPHSLPGEYYTLDQQCQMRDGPSAMSCLVYCIDNRGGTGTDCFKLMLSRSLLIMDEVMSLGGMVIVPRSACYAGFQCGDCHANLQYPFYPLAGTPCEGVDPAKSYWCYKGICQPKLTSTTQPETVVENFCTKYCCAPKRRCCKGRKCCKKRWGRVLDCCTKCKYSKPTAKPGKG